MTAVARAAQPKDYKALPSVDRLLGSEAFLPLIARFGRQEVLAAARALLGRERNALASGEAKSDCRRKRWRAAPPSTSSSVLHLAFDA